MLGGMLVRANKRTLVYKRVMDTEANKKPMMEDVMNKWLTELRASRPNLGEFTSSQHGFHAVCACCGGTLAVTVSRREIRERPHCEQFVAYHTPPRRMR